MTISVHSSQGITERGFNSPFSIAFLACSTDSWEGFEGSVSSTVCTAGGALELTNSRLFPTK